MNLYFASTAELYREARRTESLRKKLKIADELQRRHDELMCPQGMWPRDRWYWPTGDWQEVLGPGGLQLEPIFEQIRRYDFRLLLP